MKTILIIIIITLCVFLSILTKWAKIFLLALKLRGPPALPFIGNIHLVVNSSLLWEAASDFTNKYGRLCRAWISFLPLFVVAEPADVQTILADPKHNKSFFYSLMHNFLGEGLTTANGNKWKHSRKLIQPYFHLSIIKSHIESYVKGGRLFVDSLEGKSEVNIVSYVNESLLAILHEVILGIPMVVNGKINKVDSPFRKGKMDFHKRLSKPWLLFQSLYNSTDEAKEQQSHKEKLREFTRNILEQKKENHNSTVDENFSLLDKLIKISKSNPLFTEENVVNETCTFMLAGQDTVGACLSYCLYVLGKHQEIQEKVYEEIINVFGNSCITDISLTDLNKLQYLESCIKETLRLYPSVPMTARTISEDVNIGEHTIPAGSIVLVAFFATHRLPHIYPEPEKFKPERFSRENQDKLNSFAFVPFSAGPRNCIGYKFAYLELKTILAIFLQKYRVSLKPGYQLSLNFRVTFTAKGGVWLRLEPRNSEPNKEVIL